MAAFNVSSNQFSVISNEPPNNMSQIEENQNYANFVQQQSELTGGQNCTLPAQYYCNTNYFNVHNYSHLTSQYPYNNAHSNYLAGQQSTASFGADQHVSASGGQVDYQVASYGNSRSACDQLAEAGGTAAGSIALDPSANVGAENTDNQLPRDLSPINQYYPSLQQPASIYQQQQVSGGQIQPLGDYYTQFGGSQQQQCSSYDQSHAVPQPQHQVAVEANSAGSNGFHSFRAPLVYATNFNLDHSLRQNQLLLANDGSVFEQQTSQLMSNGAFQSIDAPELASIKPDRCCAPPPSLGSSSANHRTILSEATRQRSATSKLSARDNVKLAPSSQPGIQQNANASVAGKMEQLRKRHTQLLSAAAVNQRNHHGMQQQQQQRPSNNNNNNCSNNCKPIKPPQPQPQKPGSSSSTSSASLGLISRRKNATRETTSTLKDWLDEHGQNPYPTKGEKIMLSIITKMSLTQVSTWFANARRRMKKESKVFWSNASGGGGGNHNNATSCRVNSSALASSIGSGGSASALPTTNKSGASSIRYFIHKHRKQLAGASSMLALAAGEGRFAPLVYRGSASAFAQTADSDDKPFQVRAGATEIGQQVGLAATTATTMRTNQARRDANSTSSSGSAASSSQRSSASSDLSSPPERNPTSSGAVSAGSQAAAVARL